MPFMDGNLNYLENIYKGSEIRATYKSNTRKFQRSICRMENGEITATNAMKQLNIKKNAFYEFVKEYEKDNNIIEESRLENVQ